MSATFYKFFIAWAVWIIAATFYCYEYLLRILPSVMTEELRDLFQINGLALGNLSALYYYAYVPMQLPAGILMDRISPRKLLASACLICAFGTYGFAASNFYIACLGRFFIGFGSAFAFVGVMKLTQHFFPDRYFSFVTGLTTSLGMLGAMIGNLTLSHLIKTVGSSQLLFNGTLVGLVLSILILFGIPNTQTEQRPLQNFNYFLEIKRFLKDRQTWYLGLIGCFLFMSLTAFAEMWGVPYLMHCYSLSNAAAGHYNAFVFLGWAVGGPLMGSIAGNMRSNSSRYLLIAGSAFLGAICLSMMLYWPKFFINYLRWLLFFLGLFSSVQVIIFDIVKSAYPQRILGSAFAITNLIVMLGGVISQPILGYLLDNFSNTSHSTGLTTFSNQGFVSALSILPILFILTALLSLLSIRKVHHPI